MGKADAVALVVIAFFLARKRIRQHAVNYAATHHNPFTSEGVLSIFRDGTWKLDTGEDPPRQGRL